MDVPDDQPPPHLQFAMLTDDDAAFPGAQLGAAPAPPMLRSTHTILQSVDAFPEPAPLPFSLPGGAHQPLSTAGQPASAQEPASYMIPHLATVPSLPTSGQHTSSSIAAPVGWAPASQTPAWAPPPGLLGTAGAPGGSGSTWVPLSSQPAAGSFSFPQAPFSDPASLYALPTAPPPPPLPPLPTALGPAQGTGDGAGGSDRQFENPASTERLYAFFREAGVELEPGWWVGTRTRGESSKIDVFYISPAGKKYRSKQDIAKALGVVVPTAPGGGAAKATAGKAKAKGKVQDAAEEVPDWWTGSLPVTLPSGVTLHSLGSMVPIRPGHHTAQALYPVGLTSSHSLPLSLPVTPNVFQAATQGSLHALITDAQAGSAGGAGSEPPDEGQPEEGGEGHVTFVSQIRAGEFGPKCCVFALLPGGQSYIQVAEGSTPDNAWQGVWDKHRKGLLHVRCAGAACAAAHYAANPHLQPDTDTAGTAAADGSPAAGLRTSDAGGSAAASPTGAIPPLPVTITTTIATTTTVPMIPAVKGTDSLSRPATPLLPPISFTAIAPPPPPPPPLPPVPAADEAGGADLAPPPPAPPAPPAAATSAPHLVPLQPSPQERTARAAVAAAEGMELPEVVQVCMASLSELEPAQALLACVSLPQPLWGRQEFGLDEVTVLTALETLPGVSQCYEYVPLPQRQGGVKAESKTLSRDHARYVKEAQKAVAKAQGELDRQAMKAALIALKPKKRPAGAGGAGGVAKRVRMGDPSSAREGSMERDGAGADAAGDAIHYLIDPSSHPDGFLAGVLAGGRGFTETTRTRESIARVLDKMICKLEDQDRKEQGREDGRGPRGPRRPKHPPRTPHESAPSTPHPGADDGDGGWYGHYDAYNGSGMADEWGPQARGAVGNPASVPPPQPLPGLILQGVLAGALGASPDHSLPAVQAVQEYINTQLSRLTTDDWSQMLQCWDFITRFHSQLQLSAQPSLADVALMLVLPPPVDLMDAWLEVAAPAARRAARHWSRVTATLTRWVCEEMHLTLVTHMADMPNLKRKDLMAAMPVVTADTWPEAARRFLLGMASAHIIAARTAPGAGGAPPAPAPILPHFLSKPGEGSGKGPENKSAAATPLALPHPLNLLEPSHWLSHLIGGLPDTQDLRGSTQSVAAHAEPTGHAAGDVSSARDKQAVDAAAAQATLAGDGKHGHTGAAVGGTDAGAMGTEGTQGTHADPMQAECAGAGAMGTEGTHSMPMEVDSRQTERGMSSPVVSVKDEQGVEQSEAVMGTTVKAESEPGGHTGDQQARLVSSGSQAQVKPESDGLAAVLAQHAASVKQEEPSVKQSVGGGSALLHQPLRVPLLPFYAPRYVGEALLTEQDAAAQATAERLMQVHRVSRAQRASGKDKVPPASAQAAVGSQPKPPAASGTAQLPTDAKVAPDPAADTQAPVTAANPPAADPTAAAAAPAAATATATATATAAAPAKGKFKIKLKTAGGAAPQPSDASASVPSKPSPALTPAGGQDGSAGVSKLAVSGGVGVGGSERGAGLSVGKKGTGDKSYENDSPDKVAEAERHDLMCGRALLSELCQVRSKKGGTGALMGVCATELSAVLRSVRGMDLKTVAMRLETGVYQATGNPLAALTSDLRTLCATWRSTADKVSHWGLDKASQVLPVGFELGGMSLATEVERALDALLPRYRDLAPQPTTAPTPPDTTTGPAAGSARPQGKDRNALEPFCPTQEVCRVCWHRQPTATSQPAAAAVAASGGGSAGSHMGHPGPRHAMGGRATPTAGGTLVIGGGRGAASTPPLTPQRDTAAAQAHGAPCLLTCRVCSSQYHTFCTPPPCNITNNTTKQGTDTSTWTCHVCMGQGDSHLFAPHANQGQANGDLVCATVGGKGATDVETWMRAELLAGGCEDPAAAAARAPLRTAAELLRLSHLLLHHPPTQAVSECGCAGWDLHSRLSLLHTLIEAAADTRLIHDEIEKMMEAREKLRREHATLKAKARKAHQDGSMGGAADPLPALADTADPMSAIAATASAASTLPTAPAIVSQDESARLSALSTIETGIQLRGGEECLSRWPCLGTDRYNNRYWLLTQPMPWSSLNVWAPATHPSAPATHPPHPPLPPAPLVMVQVAPPHTATNPTHTTHTTPNPTDTQAPLPTHGFDGYPSVSHDTKGADGEGQTVGGWPSWVALGGACNNGPSLFLHGPSHTDNGASGEGRGGDGERSQGDGPEGEPAPAALACYADGLSLNELISCLAPDHPTEKALRAALTRARTLMSQCLSITHSSQHTQARHAGSTTADTPQQANSSVPVSVVELTGTHEFASADGASTDDASKELQGTWCDPALAAATRPAAAAASRQGTQTQPAEAEPSAVATAQLAQASPVLQGSAVASVTQPAQGGADQLEGELLGSGMQQTAVKGEAAAAVGAALVDSQAPTGSETPMPQGPDAPTQGAPAAAVKTEAGETAPVADGAVPAKPIDGVPATAAAAAAAAPAAAPGAAAAAAAAPAAAPGAAAAGAVAGPSSHDMPAKQDSPASGVVPVRDRLRELQRASDKRCAAVVRQRLLQLYDRLVGGGFRTDAFWGTAKRQSQWRDYLQGCPSTPLHLAAALTALESMLGDTALRPHARHCLRPAHDPRTCHTWPAVMYRLEAVDACLIPPAASGPSYQPPDVPAPFPPPTSHASHSAAATAWAARTGAATAMLPPAPGGRQRRAAAAAGHPRAAPPAAPVARTSGRSRVPNVRIQDQAEPAGSPVAGAGAATAYEYGMYATLPPQTATRTRGARTGTTPPPSPPAAPSPYAPATQYGSFATLPPPAPPPRPPSLPNLPALPSYTTAGYESYPTSRVSTPASAVPPTPYDTQQTGPYTDQPDNDGDDAYGEGGYEEGEQGGEEGGGAYMAPPPPLPPGPPGAAGALVSAAAWAAPPPLAPPAPPSRHDDYVYDYAPGGGGSGAVMDDDDFGGDDNEPDAGEIYEADDEDFDYRAEMGADSDEEYGKRKSRAKGAKGGGKGGAGGGKRGAGAVKGGVGKKAGASGGKTKGAKGGRGAKQGGYAPPPPLPPQPGAFAYGELAPPPPMAPPPPAWPGAQGGGWSAAPAPPPPPPPAPAYGGGWSAPVLAPPPPPLPGAAAGTGGRSSRRGRAQASRYDADYETYDEDEDMY